MSKKAPRVPTLTPRVAALPSRLPSLTGSSWRAGKTTAGRGYGAAWRRRREAQLRAEPLCRLCKADGRVTAATVADHLVPHRGDPALFDGPLQSLCATCHSARKQREEANGET